MRRTGVFAKLDHLGGDVLYVQYDPDDREMHVALMNYECVDMTATIALARRLDSAVQRIVTNNGAEQVIYTKAPDGEWRAEIRARGTA